MTYKNNNKKILITGATGALGMATAKKLYDEGAFLILCARNLDKLEKTYREWDKHRFNTYQLDLSQTKNVETKIQAIINQEKTIDVCLNLTGYNLDYQKISDMRPSQEALRRLEDIVNTDLLGTARLIFSLEPHIRKNQKGCLISLTSTPVFDIWDKDLLFQMAKAGIKKMTDCIAEQWRVDGITETRIYSVAPGNIYNPTTTENISQARIQESLKEGWLLSDKHFAPFISALIDGTYPALSGETIRLDGNTAPEIFKKMGKTYEKFEPDF